MLQVPSNQKQWKEIELVFPIRWNFPGCIGAIDSKHIYIKAPNDTPDYFNYKGRNSIILLALIYDNFFFTHVDVGWNGRASDGGVFANSTLGTSKAWNYLDIQSNAVIVGDKGFPLKMYLLKPYTSWGGLDEKQRIFDCDYQEQGR